MRYILLTALILSTTLPITAEARTWHVEPDSSGQVINIQAGIDSAAAGDTVLVATGGYDGEGNYNIDFRGKSIIVRSDGEVVIDDWYYHDDSHHAFHFHGGEDTTSVLEGFKISNFSLAILIEDSSPTIRNNNFINEIDMSSAGIHCDNSRAIIENNRIYANSYSGRKIYCKNSHAMIRNNEILSIAYIAKTPITSLQEIPQAGSDFDS